MGETGPARMRAVGEGGKQKEAAGSYRSKGVERVEGSPSQKRAGGRGFREVSQRRVKRRKRRRKGGEKGVDSRREI